MMKKLNNFLLIKSELCEENCYKISLAVAILKKSTSRTVKAQKVMLSQAVSEFQTSNSSNTAPKKKFVFLVSGFFSVVRGQF